MIAMAHTAGLRPGMPPTVTGVVPLAVMRTPVNQPAAVAPGKSSQAPGFDFVSGVSTTMQYANMSMLGVALGAPVLSGAVGFLGKGAGIAGLSGAETGIAKVASAINAPHTYIFDPEKAISLANIGVASGTSGIASTLAGGVADVSAGVVGLVANTPGISHARRWTAGSLGAAANRHHSRALNALAGVTPTMEQMLGPEFGAAITGIRGALGGKAAAMDPDAVMLHLKAASDIANKAEHADAAGVLGKVAKFADRAVDRHRMAQGLTDMPGAIRRMPGSIAKVPVGHVLNNGLVVGGTALSVYGTAQGLKGRMEALRDMCADLTGKNPKDISLYNLFLEKVPQPVADARNHLLREFGPRMFLEAANVVMNASWLLRGKDLGMLSFVGLIAAGQVMDALAGESVLEYYKNFKDAQAQGKQVPPDYYQAFLGLASPELRARGGVHSDFAKALAAEYAGEQAGPKQIMQEVVDGKMHERIERLQRHYVQEQQAGEKAGGPMSGKDQSGRSHKSDEKTGHSHVEALARRDGEKTGFAERARQSRAEIGKYTGEIAREAAVPQHVPGGIV